MVVKSQITEKYTRNYEYVTGSIEFLIKYLLHEIYT